MMARKPRIAQQGAARRARRPQAVWPVQRLQPEAGNGAERRHRCDDPDQVPGRDDIDQQSADQRADHEGRRAPQPQRSVIQAIARHAAERIGVRQRHHRGPQAAGRGIGEQHRERQILRADHGKAECGRERRHDQRVRSE